MDTKPVEHAAPRPILFLALAFPQGISQGVVAVTLGYLLGRNGVSVEAVAGIVGLNLLPQTWRFVGGPLVDASLTPRHWYVFGTLLVVLGLAGLALVPPTAAGVPMFRPLSLALGIGGASVSPAINALVVATMPSDRRGTVAGWAQTGNLGGCALSGGIGLWIAAHAGGLPAACAVLATLTLLSALPLIMLRPAAALRDGGPIRRVGRVGIDIWAQLRTRGGATALFTVMMPAGLGAAVSLLPAAARDWNASADLVASTTGLLSGVLTLPGCLAAGWLCDRYATRSVFVWSCIVIALGEAALALCPHTPAWFAGLVLLNAALLGFSYGAVYAVVLEPLGPAAAATLGSLLSSASNVPVVIVLLILGRVHTGYGSTAMLLAEVGLAALGIAAVLALPRTTKAVTSTPAPVAV